MAVKMRLQRHGSKKRPFYFIVIADARSPRDGKFIQKSAKNFEIKFVDLDGMNCVDRDITKLKGTILKTKNDTITKFKILGKNDFSGVYLIQE